jgi:hypothetical protein
MGPLPADGEEEWMQAVRGGKAREVAVYQSDGTTQVGVFVCGGGAQQSGVAEQPPSWLFDEMKRLAGSAGDANAWGWWATASAAEAATAVGDSSVSDPAKQVYIAVMVGDFTQWLWPLASEEQAPTYSWIYALIDAGSRGVYASGGSAEPLDGVRALNLNIVSLRDRIQL